PLSADWKPEIPEGLADRLDSGDWRARRDAAWLLFRQGPDPAVEEAYLRNLKDPGNHRLFRITCLSALHQWSSSKLVPALAAILSNGKEDLVVRRDCAGTLGRMGAEDAAELLIRVVLDKKADLILRAVAARALERLNTSPKRYGRALLVLLQDAFARKEEKDVKYVVWAVASVAGREKIQMAAPALGDTVKNADKAWFAYRRGNAAAGLAGANPGMLSALIRGMKTEDHFFLARAVGALGRTKAGKSLAKKMMKDKKAHPAVRWQAARSLRLGKSSPSKAAFTSFLRDTESPLGLRLEGARVFERFGARSDIAALAKVLKDGGEWPELREACARALGSIGCRGEGRVEAAESLLTIFALQNDRGLRWWAADGLNRCLGLEENLDPWDCSEAVKAFRERLKGLAKKD
ncbi:MAG: HEAT repeat domain-containing protein, partial [Planctomycetota bacterium]